MSGVNCARRNGEPDRAGGRVREQRLRDAGHAFEQHVAAGEERDEQAVDGLLLAEHDLRHLGLNAIAERGHRSRLALRSSADASLPSPSGSADSSALALVRGDTEPVGRLERPDAERRDGERLGDAFAPAARPALPHRGGAAARAPASRTRLDRACGPGRA